MESFLPLRRCRYTTLSIIYLFTETEAWFIDSFEAWREAKKLENFILLGHSFGGYVAAKYALKVRNNMEKCIHFWDV